MIGIGFILLCLISSTLSFAPNGNAPGIKRQPIKSTEGTARTKIGRLSMKKVVLIGGGHAHLQVIKAFNKRDRPRDWHVTLVDKASFASYSGMVPGCISNLYEKTDVQILLQPLAEWASVDFLKENVINIDPEDQRVFLESGAILDYDVLSVDIGSKSKGLEIPGVLENTIPTRPIDLLVDKIQETRNSLREGDPVKLFVVGGGIAGIELAMCIRSSFESIVEHLDVTILDSSYELLPTESVLCKDAMSELLVEKKITVRHGCRVSCVNSKIIELEDGSQIPYTHMVWACGASAHSLSSNLRDAGISVSEDGWIKVGPTLQTLSHNNIFAAGDCANIEGLRDPETGQEKESPPKAGVYAVRSGPVLVENISRHLKTGESSCNDNESLTSFVPQESFLKLLVCGDGTALGFRFGLPLKGKWVWQLKDAIDMMFMDLFRVETLPDLSEVEGSGYDTSQYDQQTHSEICRLSAEEGARLLLRTDDDVDFQVAWKVLRDMMADESYADEVIQTYHKYRIIGPKLVANSLYTTLL